MNRSHGHAFFKNYLIPLNIKITDGAELILTDDSES